MSDIQTWVNALGPTGAILALGIAFMKGLWPWIRDQYLARQVDSLDKLVVLMTEFNARQVGAETVLSDIRAHQVAQSEDLARIFTVLESERPSRPRRAPPAKGAASNA